MTDQAQHSQVLILGAGPAGLALAAACRREELSVRVIDRSHAEWPNQYAGWKDELEPLGLEPYVGHIWPTACVWLDEGDKRILNRPYAVIDNDACREAVKAQANGTEWTLAEVEAVQARGAGGTVRTSDGTTYSGDVLIDALGTFESSVAARRVMPTAFQTAYGILAEVEGIPSSDAVTFMDFRNPAPGIKPLPGDCPSFLYSMQWPDGRWFFEETVLVGRPAIAVDVLKGRLERRLEHHGIRVVRIDHVERCNIGMDVSPFARDAEILRFGAAAGMVHPATGYSFVESFKRAHRVAKAIQRELAGGIKTTSKLSVADAIWTPDERKCHALFQFGSDAVAGFSADDTRRFMRAFFSLPTDRWSDYLSRRLTSSEVQATMLTMFKRFPLRLKRKMTGISLWKPKLLVRGIFGH